MATLKTSNGHGKYFDEDAKQNVIDYLMRKGKTPHGYAGGVGVDGNDIVGSMKEVSEQFGKSNGVQLRHFIISFEQSEINNISTVDEIAREAAIFLVGNTRRFTQSTRTAITRTHILSAIRSATLTAIDTMERARNSNNSWEKCKVR